MSRPSLVLALVVLAAPVADAADAIVVAGERVRVTEGGRRYTAQVLESLPGALLVSVQGGTAPRRLDLSRLERLEISGGRQSHGRTGFLVGFLSSATLGGLLGAATCRGGCSAEVALVDGALLGTIGGALGALVGCAIQTERWNPMDLPSRPAVRVQPHVAPVRGGVMAGLTLRF